MEPVPIEGSAAKAKRESPIEREMKHLSDCLESLDETIGRLRCKLETVLGAETPQPEKTKGATEPASESPILRSLTEFSRRIVAENETLSDLIDHLET